MIYESNPISLNVVQFEFSRQKSKLKLKWCNHLHYKLVYDLALLHFTTKGTFRIRFFPYLQRRVLPISAEAEAEAEARETKRRMVLVILETEAAFPASP